MTVATSSESDGVIYLCGDCREMLALLPTESVHCVVTSPPYWGLRDYGIEPSVWGGNADCTHEWGDPIEKKGGGGQPGEKRRWQHEGAGPSGHPASAAGAFCHCGAWRGCLGLEPTYQAYVAHMVEVFRAVRRVLRKDGTLWLNLGDCYATGAGKVGEHPGGGAQGSAWAGRPALGSTSQLANRKVAALDGNRGVHTAAHSGKQGYRIDAMGPMTQPNRVPQSGLKPKDLVGIPWRVAFALQDDGWWLRQDIIWSKPNPMPESVTDRCTKAHEYLFLLTKAERYWFDAAAIAEPATKAGQVLHTYGTAAKDRQDSNGTNDRRTRIGLANWNKACPDTRNRRSVWKIATHPFPEAHFATFPPALVEPCIKAGSTLGGIVLDPFGGSGTTAAVARKLGRRAILIDVKPDYIEMAKRRVAKSEEGAGARTT